MVHPFSLLYKVLPFLALMNSAAKHILVCIFWCTHMYSFPNDFPPAVLWICKTKERSVLEI